MKKIITLSVIIGILLTGCSKEPIADFTYRPSNPIAGETVSFTNLSLDAESFEWNFDDGTTSTSYDPTHVFMAGGTYSVQLKAYGKRRGFDAYQVNINVVSIPPEAEFGIYTYLPGDDGPEAHETDLVFAGEEVEFYNTSNNAVTYNWDYGDGYASDQESPVYSYDVPGTYEVTLTCYGLGNEVDSYTKTIEVVEGVNSTVRITVLEYYEEYPIENASVILYESVDDWETQTDPSPEVFTTPLGKCVFEGLNYQRYYVDAWEANHDNYQLAAEDVGFIETQPLEPGYIHDFFAYVDYYEDGKKVTMTRISKKKLAKDFVSNKKNLEKRALKQTTFSKAK